MDERGYFKIVDRKKDMVLVSGFNVYPNEVEDVVAWPASPACWNAPWWACPTKDRRGREAGHREEGPSLRSHVREFCKANLTGYKQPKVIEFRTELPKTPVARSCG